MCQQVLAGLRLPQFQKHSCKPLTGAGFVFASDFSILISTGATQKPQRGVYGVGAALARRGCSALARLRTPGHVQPCGGQPAGLTGLSAALDCGPRFAEASLCVERSCSGLAGYLGDRSWLSHAYPPPNVTQTGTQSSGPRNAPHADGGRAE